MTVIPGFRTHGGTMVGFLRLLDAAILGPGATDFRFCALTARPFCGRRRRCASAPSFSSSASPVPPWQPFLPPPPQRMQLTTPPTQRHLQTVPNVMQVGWGGGCCIESALLTSVFRTRWPKRRCVREEHALQAQRRRLRWKWQPRRHRRQLWRHCVRAHKIRARWGPGTCR